MKRMTRLAIVALTLLFSVYANAADITGTWTASFDTQVGKQEYTYTFNVDGSTVNGAISSGNGESEVTNGMLDGDTLTFTENLNYQGTALEVNYTGTVVSDTEIKFTRDVGGFANEELVATRSK